MENEELYRKLVIFLKIFKNRPFHLAKYLVENNAFNEDFLKKIIDSEKLENSKEENQKVFFDINQMTEHFNLLTDDVKKTVSKTEEELTSELNIRMENLLKEEKYEEAALLRDYMQRHNIKRFK